MEGELKMDNRVDLESNDYDVEKIVNYDYRFEIGRKNAVLLHILGFVCSIAATVWIFYFGTGDPAQMKYFLGLPLWVSGAIIIYLGMFVIGMVYIMKWDEFSLKAKDHSKGGKQ